MVLYRVNKSTVSSVKQVNEALQSAETGANVEFTIGMSSAWGEP